MMDRLAPLWDFFQELIAELQEVLSPAPPKAGDTAQPRRTEQQRQRVLRRMMLGVFVLLLEVTVAASAYSAAQSPVSEQENAPSSIVGGMEASPESDSQSPASP